MAPIVFDPPEGFHDLTLKERRAMRRAWRKDPATKEAKAKARAEARAAAEAFFDDFVLSPVLDLLAPMVREAIEADPDGDHEDIIDEVLDESVEKLDELARFDNLRKIHLVGPLLSELAEKASDALILQARDRLETKIREAFDKVLAEMEGHSAR